MFIETENHTLNQETKKALVEILNRLIVLNVNVLNWVIYQTCGSLNSHNMLQWTHELTESGFRTVTDRPCGVCTFSENNNTLFHSVPLL